MEPIPNPPQPSSYLLLASLGHIFIILGLDARTCLDVDLLGLDFDIAATGLIGGIVQRTDFRAYRLQIGRRRMSHLHLVHWNWEEEEEQEEAQVAIEAEPS